MRLRWFTLPDISTPASGLLLGAATKDCIFLKDPDQFTPDVKRLQQARSDLTVKVSMYVSRAVFGDQLAVRTLDAEPFRGRTSSMIPSSTAWRPQVFNRRHWLQTWSFCAV